MDETEWQFIFFRENTGTKANSAYTSRGNAQRRFHAGFWPERYFNGNILRRITPDHQLDFKRATGNNTLDGLAIVPSFREFS